MKHPWNRKAKAQRTLEDVAVGDNTAAASDEALLQQAKLKAQDAWKTVFLGDNRPADSHRDCCLNHASRVLHGLVPGSHGPRGSACKAEVALPEGLARLGACRRLDLNPGMSSMIKVLQRQGTNTSTSLVNSGYGTAVQGAILTGEDLHSIGLAAIGRDSLTMNS